MARTAGKSGSPSKKVELRRQRQSIGKGDLASIAARKVGITCAQATGTINAVLEAIAASTKNGVPVRLMNFGRFYLHQAPSKPGRNPRTGVPLQIAERKVLKFRAASELKDV